MSTDLKVQFFSHLNGINLGNNWGDLIRMLDTCLVNGLPFTSVMAASIDANGDINLTFFAAHNAVLFQIVELTGFSPSNINGKYRIKGLPTSTQIILKAELSGQSITANGSAKLAALGYEIIFRDANDVKRVYRAKNPRAEHPFIRVDETISDGVNSYNSAYAKSAMVGLVENMAHIDDYEDTGKLQLPLNTADFRRNWKITGTGTNCVRGWSKWYWATQQAYLAGPFEFNAPPSGNRRFTLTGDDEAFYITMSMSTSDQQNKVVYGCGLFDSTVDPSVSENWFLISTLRLDNAGSTNGFSGYTGGTPFVFDTSSNKSGFFVPKYSIANKIVNHDVTTPILPDLTTGYSNIYSASNIGALQIPFVDNSKHLRGTLKHIFYAGNIRPSNQQTTPLLYENNMYVWDSIWVQPGVGGMYFYLGELE
ncbi:hypothetical protein NGC85_05905 [Acinetobacter sp. Z1]|uniref:hypothetical protein n=1 Tax=Acinetobacter sp. Z1 TaxID=2953738 RepID=UPI0020C94FF9|nr:hypothetical protein [Acinetobacter sp. Z1]UTO20615.1 hypothetical protein NGC85_05905 [Acinetobacter sp. Z1]